MTVFSKNYNMAQYCSKEYSSIEWGTGHMEYITTVNLIQ